MHELFFIKFREKVALPKEKESKIRKLLSHRNLKKGEFLVRAGQISREIAFIEKGTLKTYLIDSKGNEQVIFFGLEGWTMGDLNSFMKEEPARYYIEAIENSELTLIERKAHDELIRTVPMFETYIRILMTDAYMASQKRTADMINLPLENRYRNFIAKYPNILQRVPQYMIASYLGVSPETLSRIRTKIEI